MNNIFHLKGFRSEIKPTMDEQKRSFRERKNKRSKKYKGKNAE